MVGGNPMRDTRTADGWIAPIHLVQDKVSALRYWTFVSFLGNARLRSAQDFDRSLGPLPLSFLASTPLVLRSRVCR
jgi:hypothetical protein